ncbi:MAG: peptidylprolyl isomerase [Bacteroidetes bacterium]|uniref:Peptidyl-prolyl cis-trans isomerase n=1 Tax=Phaeocystidibacter marisrubri TaxID=1577780 RepID=A0A6L3ZJ98_9FLAO|nr:peptidylprolyl isomerase [Phaeocystidibacter marisrubri]KAB2817505.1 peptidylprolyl isomerase [Phaeocystidibacter marisrubri]TNE28688.1 MAG: peptidylprolyl isomerase [Bacteroidota bacterium]GGH75011.1 peptidyl-prolyl cis-trans isomerase [Phaeocystidibacter marisrubri]
MSTAKANDKVRVHYTGKLNSGEIFDSSVDREPLEFTVGAGQMIAGFDAAVDGMEVNEKKTVTLSPEQAYGPVNQELYHKVERSQLPADLKPEVGQILVAGSPDGREMQVKVHEVQEEAIIIDANHPLAGQELTFDIQLVEIV